ncbi:MAG: class I SAM-dependent methyltransferase [Dehalococcoidia bacterium]|nr:class I SAM-dependent methyltransferase [Dehalococcoidia bacterium]
MIVVRGKKISELSRAGLAEHLAPYEGVTIDVGTGDGAFAYRYAQRQPARFVIGLDPVREAMREYSAKAAGKPARGGLPNVLYVVASVEQPPAELHAIADELYVNLPWGSMMRGVILGDPVVLEGLASLARDGGRLRVVVNMRIFDDPVPIEARDLPEPTPAYARGTLAPAYDRAGLRITEARAFAGDEMAELATTWAKRLSHRRAPPSLLIEAVADGHE